MKTNTVDKLHTAKMIRFVSDSEENIVGMVTSIFYISRNAFGSLPYEDHYYQPFKRLSLK